MANANKILNAEHISMVVNDIYFACEDMAEFGHKTTPMLRYVAGLTYGTDISRAEFVEACEQEGYLAATAGVCWAAGRKVMADMDAEWRADPLFAKYNP